MNSKDQSALQNDNGNQEKHFADYLRRHPDFFERHASLLAQLVIPHPTSGQAVSLLERQLMILREQQGETQRQLRSLISNARNNEKLYQRMDEISLYLLRQRSFVSTMEQLTPALKRIFDLEFVTFLQKSIPTELQEITNAYCTSDLDDEGLEILFNGAANEIRSCAIIPVHAEDQSKFFGVFAFGATDEKRYHRDTGTHYLLQLQKLLCASFTRLDGAGLN